MNHMQNKTVVITGASKGIGAATARHFAALGVNVMLLARSEDPISQLAEEITSKGGNAAYSVCDVARYSDVKASLDMAVQHFGTIDVLVNNAGLIDPIARLTDSEPEEWSNIVDINYKGVYYGLHAALPIMLKQGGGTIINISSGAATSALEGWSHYCSSKAAVLMLTRCADKEYGESNINIVGLSPGTVATHMQSAIKTSGINPVSQLDWSKHIPAEWVAKAIEFLCGPNGTKYKGTDFSLKNDEGRRLVRLPLI